MRILRDCFSIRNRQKVIDARPLTPTESLASVVNCESQIQILKLKRKFVTSLGRRLKETRKAGREGGDSGEAFSSAKKIDRQHRNTQTAANLVF